MATQAKGPRLGKSPAHERLMLANLATSLFQHGQITTTETKAKRLRPYAERLITKARRGDLHNRRQVSAVIRDKEVVHTLFTQIGPEFANRHGGYTRITKLGPRKGDNAPMAVIELVEGSPEGGAGGQTVSAPAAEPAPVADSAPEPEASVEPEESVAAEAEDTAQAESEAEETEAGDTEKGTS